MNLEQVKKHFKYAKEVRCLADNTIHDLTKINEKGIVCGAVMRGFIFKQLGNDLHCYLYNSTTNQLAEILTYIFDRGEEVEVSANGDVYFPHAFIGVNKKNQLICEDKQGIPYRFNYYRKLTPESLLEPQLTELKNKAKEMNCTVTVIFENK